MESRRNSSSNSSGRDCTSPRLRTTYEALDASSYGELSSVLEASRGRVPVGERHPGNPAVPCGVARESSPERSTRPEWLRFVILCLCSTIAIGNFYGYDVPAAIAVPLQAHFDLPPAQWQIFASSFYSLYSLPNVFLPVLGGHLVDNNKRWGYGTWLIIFGSVMFVGHLCFVMGLVSKSVGLALVGRLIFGVGGESLYVTSSRLTTRWFRGKELAFALGFNLSVSRIGSVASDLFSPYLAATHGINSALAASLAVCLASYVLTFILAHANSKYDAPDVSRRSVGDYIPLAHGLSGKSGIKSSEIDLLESDGHGLPSAGLGLASSSADPMTATSSLLAKLKGFPVLVWVLCGLVACTNGLVVPFNAIHAAFLKQRWYQNDAQKAGQAMGIPDSIAAIAVPVVGVLCDYMGRRTLIMALACLAIGTTHFTLGLLNPFSPLPWLVVLGLGYSLLSVNYPSFPLLVDDSEVATVFGIASVTLNASWTVIPFVTAQLVIVDPTYTLCEMFFAALAFTGLGLSYVIWRLDGARYGGILARPEMRKAASLAESHR